jgi:hypothetical protein
MKKYQFDINIGSNALLEANPKEFFTAALLSNKSTSMFRQLLNVKEKTKISGFEFQDVLQAESCTFTKTDSDLDAKTLEPCKLQIGVELCQYDLESSFLADWMRAGSNQVDFSPVEFMAHYYERLAAKVADNLEVLTWKGDTAGMTGTYLDLCDGLETKLNADVDVIDIPAAAITSANVIAQMTLVYEALPVAIRNQKSNLVWYVADNVAAAYQIAVATASAEVYTRQNPELTFLGIQLMVAEGMTDNKMVCSRKDNFLYITDLVSDQSEVITINMKSTTGDRLIRSISDFKFGVDYVNPTEIVYYK